MENFDPIVAQKIVQIQDLCWGFFPNFAAG